MLSGEKLKYGKYLWLRFYTLILSCFTLRLVLEADEEVDVRDCW